MLDHSRSLTNSNWIAREDNLQGEDEARSLGLRNSDGPYLLEHDAIRIDRGEISRGQER